MSKAWIAASIGISIVAVLIAVAVTTHGSHTPPAPIGESEPSPCETVGDVCSLRPPRKAALAFSTQKYYVQDMKLREAQDNDGMGKMLGEGKSVIILLGLQVRILQLTDNGAEALVVRDMWDLEKDTLKRRGNPLDGRKLWIDKAQWVLAER
jgi:hypothetical protein